MRLFESIVDANHKAVAGDASAGLHPDEFADAFPIIALTCIDPRLNAFFPNILGVPADQFIWLRNAGNIITGPLSSTMRSLALACAVKGGKEIAVIGHTDCQVARTTAMELLSRFQSLGVDRSRLPENLNEFFGVFASERQNVMKACDFVRQSPLIGPNIPVHGLLADIETGKLDWIVNGYEKLVQAQAPSQPQQQTAAGALTPLSGFGSLKDFEMGEMKFPAAKIGEWVSAKVEGLKMAGEEEIQKAQPVVESAEAAAKQAADYAKQQWGQASQGVPPKIPRPPPIRPARLVRKR
ncbi:MAG TPA: carbonic anhydrase [Candidatus Sulfotelmatobacter sp.]|nr:carbonic anhydrase [Candidatus Sulfotelmatobacter sp.]